MKYSLRNLMIVVTLVCVVIGARIEYLRRWVFFTKEKRYAMNLNLGESAAPIPS